MVLEWAALAVPAFLGSAYGIYRLGHRSQDRDFQAARLTVLSLVVLAWGFIIFIAKLPLPGAPWNVVIVAPATAALLGLVGLELHRLILSGGSGPRASGPRHSR